MMLPDAAAVHSLERYRSLIENLPDVIWTADAAGRAVYISSRIEEVFGFTPAEVYAKGEELWLGRIHPDHLHDVWTAYQGLFADPPRLFDVVYLYHHKDGHWVWIHDRALTTWERDGVKYTDGTLSDISQLKSLEEQLRQSQKMEAVGRLTAGIAHDFNNLLTAILGYSELLLEDVGGRPELAQPVEEILRAAQRAASLTQQLLAFSRKQVLQPSVIDLPRLLQQLEPMLRRIVGDRVTLRLEGLEGGARVRADRDRLEQVVLNLVVNARDAMPSGGRLVLGVAILDASVERLQDVPGGALVLLSIADTGVGMDEYTCAHIFEPFFTTKDVGKGTGLGLSTAYGTIKQSGGHITVTTRLGSGTTFDVYLPLLPPDAEGRGR